MKAIIPVAGFGTRMRPHTLTHPKVLLPVADKPMIAHILNKLIADGVNEFIFVVGHLGREVEKYIRSSFQVKCHFLTQSEFLGLGHAISMAGDFLDNQPLIIVLGDTIYDVDLKPVLNGQFSSLGVKKVDNPRRFGVAVLDDAGFVTRLVEKPTEIISDLALVGLYYFTDGKALKDALQTIMEKDIRTNNEYQLTDALQVMIEQGSKMKTFTVEGWYDCGKPETLLQTNAILLARDFADADYKFEHTVVIPPVFIHPTSKLKNTVIGPHVTVGENCEIENTVLSNSILGIDSKIKNTVLSDSILGDHIRIEGKNQKFNIGDYSQTE